MTGNEEEGEEEMREENRVKDREKEQDSNISDLDDNEKRIRQYGEDAKGPYVVYLRSPKRHKLNVVVVSGNIYKKYASVKMIIPVNRDKLRIIFEKKAEANALPIDPLFRKDYYIYIPASLSEVDGKVFLNENVETHGIIKKCLGIMRNSTEVVKVVDAFRLKKKIKHGDQEKFEDVPFVRVTFEGTSLPDYLMVDKLRIPILPYAPKVMRCAICLLAGHSHKHCSNLPRCHTCGLVHDTSADSENCKAQSFLCPNCHLVHRQEDHNCQKITQIKNDKVTAILEKRRERRKTALNRLFEDEKKEDDPPKEKTKQTLPALSDFPPLPTLNRFGPLSDEDSEYEVSELEMEVDDTNDEPRMTRKRKSSDKSGKNQEKKWHGFTSAKSHNDVNKNAEVPDPVPKVILRDTTKKNDTRKVSQNAKPSKGWLDLIIIILEKFRLEQDLLNVIKEALPFLETLLCRLFPKLFADTNNKES